MARSTVGARIFVDCGFTWNCIARQCLVVRVIAVCDNWHFVQLTAYDTRGEQPHHTTTNEIQFFNLGNSLQLRKKTLP